MGKKQEYQPLFPDYLNHLNESYTGLQRRLSAIDYELRNAPKDKGPTPASTPRGMRMINPELRQERRKFLEKMREANVQGFKKYSQKQIGYLSEKNQKILGDRYDFETSKNRFKDYSKDNLKEVRECNKDDKISMDYMEAQHFGKYQLPDKSFAVEKENIDVWSERYQKMLDYYRDGSTVPTIEINDREPEKDGF